MQFEFAGEAQLEMIQPRALLAGGRLERQRTVSKTS